MALFGFVGGLLRAAARIVMPGIVRAVRTVKGVLGRLEVMALTYTPEEVMRGDIMAAVGEHQKEPLWRRLPHGQRPGRDLFVSAEFRAPYRYWYKVQATYRDAVTGRRRTEVVSLTSDDILTPDEVAEQLGPVMIDSDPEHASKIISYRMITGWHDPTDTW